MEGIPVIPMRELNLKDPKVFLCIGYAHYNFFSTELVAPETMKGRFFSEDVMFTMDTTERMEYLDYKFFISNRAGFEKVYNLLEDEKSKRILEAYLNQRISGRLKYLQDLWTDDSYFNNEVVNLSKVTCFVDCGAYIGDTYESFLKSYEQGVGCKYKGKAYLWEPAESNCNQIREKFGVDENVILLKQGAWNKKGELKFSDILMGQSGSFVRGGELKVEVNSIDNVIHEKIDFIKMDIEGSEYNALLGAEKAIKANSPILAICVYHRRDDLLKIPELIKNFDGEYKFYLRAHSRYSSDIVLYAVK